MLGFIVELIDKQSNFNWLWQNYIGKPVEN